MTAGSIVLEAPDAGWRIEPLFDPAGAPLRARGGRLPPPLASRYGEDLAIALRADRPTIVSNFVTTLDGVVAFDANGDSGGREVSGGFSPDRFLMGLLRATADAILVGAGTVRSGARHVWTPGHVHPPSAGAYASWRRQLGLSRQPTTVIVTASGRIDPDHPGLAARDVPVLLATTTEGAGRLRRRALPGGVEVIVAGDRGRVDEDVLVGILAGRGFEVVVCEGGPSLLGGLVARGFVDELFLTIAPQIAGRMPGMPRLSLVEGVGFGTGDAPWAELSSVGRAGDHLFLRYRLTQRPRQTGVPA